MGRVPGVGDVPVVVVLRGCCCTVGLPEVFVEAEDLRVRLRAAFPELELHARGVREVDLFRVERKHVSELVDEGLREDRLIARVGQVNLELPLRSVVWILVDRSCRVAARVVVGLVRRHVLADERRRRDLDVDLPDGGLFGRDSGREHCSRLDDVVAHRQYGAREVRARVVAVAGRSRNGLGARTREVFARSVCECRCGAESGGDRDETADDADGCERLADAAAGGLRARARLRLKLFELLLQAWAPSLVTDRLGTARRCFARGSRANGRASSHRDAEADSRHPPELRFRSRGLASTGRWESA